MNNHTLDIKEFIDWQQKQLVRYAHSTREQKTLYCKLGGGYEVWHKGEKVLECIQPIAAIEKYNSLTSN